MARPPSSLRAHAGSSGVARGPLWADFRSKGGSRRASPEAAGRLWFDP